MWATPGSRRGFLSWFLGTSVGALGASMLYPVVRYLSPPEVPEAATSRAVACRESELKINEGRIFRPGAARALAIFGWIAVVVITSLTLWVYLPAGG